MYIVNLYDLLKNCSLKSLEIVTTHKKIFEYNI